MKEEVNVLSVRILVEMVDSSGVERRRSANDSVDLVALENNPWSLIRYLREEKLSQIGTILTRDTGNQGNLLLCGTLSAIRHAILDI